MVISVLEKNKEPRMHGDDWNSSFKKQILEFLLWWIALRNQVQGAVALVIAEVQVGFLAQCNG